MSVWNFCSLCNKKVESKLRDNKRHVCDKCYNHLSAVKSNTAYNKDFGPVGGSFGDLFEDVDKYDCDEDEDSWSNLYEYDK